MLPRFAKPVTAAVVVAVLACSSVQVRAAVARWESRGNAFGGWRESELRGTAHRIVPHDGQWCWCVPDNAWGFRCACCSQRSGLPATMAQPCTRKVTHTVRLGVRPRVQRRLFLRTTSRLGPRSPCPSCRWARSSNSRQGKTFPASGIGNHNHFLNTIYTPARGLALTRSVAPARAVPESTSDNLVSPTFADRSGAAHHTIHHTIHHHQTLITNPSYIPAADHDALLVPPLPPPTAFLQAGPGASAQVQQALLHIQSTQPLAITTS